MVGVWYISAAILAFLIAMTHSFCLNTVFTFRESPSRLTSRRLFKFGTVSVCALTLNLFVLYTLTEVAGVFYLFSQVFAIGSASLLNFFANKLWTFRTP